MFNPTAAPLVIDSLDDVVSAGNAPDTLISLSNHFDDPFTTGLVAEFELFDGSLGDGTTEVLLFDQATAGAPLSVENFVDYVVDGAYVNTIIHRSVPGFIIQGGGFTIDGFETVVAPGDAVSELLSNPPVQNEFSEARSNLRGTIAFAKVGNDANSATNQWFFNLADNAANLDNQNEGFTVFGEVLSESDLDGLDEIAALPIFDARTFFNEGAFNEFPLILDDPAVPAVNSDDNFVRYQNITLFQRPELAFSVVNNTNSELVTAVVADESLTLDYVPGQAGTAEITVQATNLVRAVIEDTFTVTVAENNDPEAEDDSALTDEDTSITITLAELLENDDDPDSNDLLQIVAVDTTSSLGATITNNGDGTLTYTPRPSARLQALPAEGEATDTFSYQLNDDNGGTAIGTVSINVSGVNDSPTITSPSAFSVVENLTAVGRITAIDMDTERALVFGLSGVDASAFTIDSASGELRFNSPINFENPTDANQDNTFELLVSVSDGTATDNQALTITVTDDMGNVSLNIPTVNINGQGQVDGVIYDTTTVAFGTQVNAVLANDPQAQTNAQFDNLVGFYQVVNAEGGIDTNGDGLVDVVTGDAGYAQAAIENRVTGLAIRVGASGAANQNTTAEGFGDLLLDGGFYAPFVIANGGSLGFDGFLAAEAAETDGVFNEAASALEDAVAYFSFLGANPDRAEHIRALGNNTFGFEDLPSNLGGSDNDFNDAVFSIGFRA